MDDFIELTDGQWQHEVPQRDKVLVRKAMIATIKAQVIRPNDNALLTRVTLVNGDTLDVEEQVEQIVSQL
jgi:hypothetical protein